MLNSKYDASNVEFQDFFMEVCSKLKEFGYNERFAMCYRYDIYEFFEKNYTVDQVIKEIA